jgi:hypothetical protein
VTPEQAIQTYYALRNEYHRPLPKQMPKRIRESDRLEMCGFLDWCGDRAIVDPAGYMRERFRQMFLASRRRGVPRITQLASDALAAKWSGWIEGERIADLSYARRMAGDDSYALHVKSLAAKPHVTKESFKRRLAQVPDACFSQLRHSGGYHPDSTWCRRCACAVRCAAALNTEHGFDVVALRSGQVNELPARVASAYVR